MISQPQNNRTNKKQVLISIFMVVLLIIVLFLFDKRILMRMQELMGPENLPIAEMVTHHGLYIFYAIFAALFAYSLIRKNKKWINLCLAYLLTQLIFAFGVVRILKIVFGRARPKFGFDFNFFAFGFDVNSFPSGHAADAFVSGVFLYYLLRNSKYPAASFLPLVYAFLIATSRAFVNSHYPSDVAAGMAIGIFGSWFFLSRLANPDKPELKIED
jgi:membrane-associated phospholipid phosphatase